ncbi:MAG: MarC family protein [Pseudomonadota bacterium]
MLNWQDLFRDFITMFVVIDPIGSIPVFFFAARGVPPELHARFAIHAVAAATVILLLFLIGGQILFEALELSLGAFQVSGGIVLFMFATTMIFGDSKPTTEIQTAKKDHLSGAIYPLAIPSIASPGAMLAVVILTDNNTFSIQHQAVTAGILLIVLAITLVVLLLATFIRRVIGDSGASVISRVMGIILATVAVDSVLAGLQSYGVLGASG